MSTALNRPPLTGRTGATLVEFGISVFLLMMLLLAVIDVGRMALVYTTVANAARAGARYAIVHGGTRSGTGVDGPSGPANNPAQVVTVIKNFAGAGALNTSLLVINVNYPDPFPGNAPGERVNVSVVYPYDPLTSYLPFRVRLGSATQGIITF